MFLAGPCQRSSLTVPGRGPAVRRRRLLWKLPSPGAQPQAPGGPARRVKDSTGATVREYGCYRERVRRLPGDGTVRRVWKDSSAVRSRSGRPPPGRRRVGTSLADFCARNRGGEESRAKNCFSSRGVRRRRSAVGGDAQVARDGRWCTETER